jgi:hypothetical protein
MNKTLVNQGLGPGRLRLASAREPPSTGTGVVTGSGTTQKPPGATEKLPASALGPAAKAGSPPLRVELPL